MSQPMTAPRIPLTAGVREKDLAMLRLAREAATNAPHGCSKVGVVVCDPRGRVRTVTWDDYPRGLEETARQKQGTLHYPLGRHAEQRAMHDAVGTVEGCTLYVYAVPPCADCAKAILDEGIARVVAIEQDETTGYSRISPPVSVMFAAAKLPYIVYKRDELDQERK